MNIYTDIALEIAQSLSDKREPNFFLDGVKIETVSSYNDKIQTTCVNIFNGAGEKLMQKPKGNYITIESQCLKENDNAAHEEIISVLSKKLQELDIIKKSSSFLIVGLGNEFVTPDALGPKVISKILITRHIKESLPKDIDESVSVVSGLAPGVMGLTGIETVDVVKGLVDAVKPDLVIAIDSLAARSTNRINATIQISDTGVTPGAGMGNKRKSLDENTLGVPVLAIGVPTVVDAATLVTDTMNIMIENMIKYSKENAYINEGKLFESLFDLTEEERYDFVKEVLEPLAGNMFVTPKEVDSVMDRLSKIISNAINITLHKGINIEDINKYT